MKTNGAKKKIIKGELLRFACSFSKNKRNKQQQQQQQQNKKQIKQKQNKTKQKTKAFGLFGKSSWDKPADVTYIYFVYSLLKTIPYDWER